MEDGRGVMGYVVYRGFARYIKPFDSKLKFLDIYNISIEQFDYCYKVHVYSYDDKEIAVKKYYTVFGIDFNWMLLRDYANYAI